MSVTAVSVRMLVPLGRRRLRVRAGRGGAIGAVIAIAARLGRAVRLVAAEVASVAVAVSRWRGWRLRCKPALATQVFARALLVVVFGNTAVVAREPSRGRFGFHVAEHRHVRMAQA